MKRFYITRLEESKVLKQIEYEIIAPNKTQAIKKLNRMQYVLRDTRDEVEENDWKPKEILLIEESAETSRHIRKNILNR